MFGLLKKKKYVIVYETSDGRTVKKILKLDDDVERVLDFRKAEKDEFEAEAYSIAIGPYYPGHEGVDIKVHAWQDPISGVEWDLEFIVDGQVYDIDDLKRVLEDEVIQARIRELLGSKGADK